MKVFVANKVRAALEGKLREGLDWVSWTDIVAPGARVSIKPNFTYPRHKPGVTTTPALLEAAVKLRRRAWQGRELPLEPEAWSRFQESNPSPGASAERHELFDELQKAIASELTPHQREVLIALALNDVPIDVLADRLGTTRGALYKTLHDARRKLRAKLAARGMSVEERGEDS